MTKAEEIEQFIQEFKNDIADAISFLIIKEERESGLSEEESAHRNFLEGQIQLCETIGSTYFNWE